MSAPDLNAVAAAVEAARGVVQAGLSHLALPGRSTKTRSSPMTWPVRPRRSRPLARCSTTAPRATRKRRSPARSRPRPWPTWPPSCSGGRPAGASAPMSSTAPGRSWPPTGAQPARWRGRDGHAQSLAAHLDLGFYRSSYVCQVAVRGGARHDRDRPVRQALRRPSLIPERVLGRWAGRSIQGQPGGCQPVRGPSRPPRRSQCRGRWR